MANTLVTLEAKMIINDKSPEELINFYDGTIASDGLHIVTENGRKLIVECVDSKITEILVYTEEDEEISFLNKKAEIQYYPSLNKVFRINDLLRIKDKGIFTIIITPKFSFLYNSDNTSTIDIEGITNVTELKVYLENNYPEYQVLRKIT